MRVRLALAAIATCLASGSGYAVLRIVARLRAPDADPTVVFYSPHAGFFWRGWTAAFVGVSFGFVAWIAAGREPERTGRVLLWGVAGTMGLVVGQALLVP